MEFLWSLLLLLLRLLGIEDGGQQGTPSFCSCFDCSETVLGRDAFGASCLDRIEYLQNFESNLYPEPADACQRVASIEYPSICGACDPSSCDGRTPDPPTRTSFCGCASCTLSEWKSVANAADGLSCEARVTWLQTHIAEYSASDERLACHRIAQDFHLLRVPNLVIRSSVAGRHPSPYIASPLTRNESATTGRAILFR